MTNKLSKFPAALLKTARTLYIYADGHGVVVHEKRDRDAGMVSWVTLHEKVATPMIRDRGELHTESNQDSRLIVTRNAIPMVLAAAKHGPVYWSLPSIAGGSQTSREMGLKVGNVGLNFGQDTVYLSVLEDVLSADIYPNKADVETWEDVKTRHSWCTYNITNKYTLE